MKRFLLSIIGFMAIALGMNAETYTHTFEGSIPLNGTVTLNSIEWTTTSSNTGDSGFNDERGVQFGGKAAACESFSLTTNAFKEFTVSSVTVYSISASGCDAKMTIKAGNTTSEQFAITNDAESPVAYKFECREQGDITISLSATEKKAYYIQKIEVVYELPTEMVDIEEPKFKTPVGVYENKAAVTVETDDQSLVLYYTMDGTTPSYEDYQNETGSTLCSKYHVMYFLYDKLLTKTTTIKVIAVKVDGESVYKSDVVEETYIVSPTKPYIPAKEITSGKRYALVANDSIADFLHGASNGNLQGRKISAKYNKYIEAIEYDAFTFTSTDGGYTIQDAENRYMYLEGNDGKVSFATEKPATGAVWSVIIDSYGKATIKSGDSTVYYSVENDVFGCYTADQVTADMVLPSVYMLYHYPEYTIMPGTGSTIDKLQSIIITCDEGIKASSDLKVTVSGYYTKNNTFTCKQIDDNTLELGLETILTTVNNDDLDVKITKGNILLNPNVLSMNMPTTAYYGSRILVEYTLTGDAPAATINKIVPADNETVEKLSYILFTFSDITNPSENEALQPRLYAEGSEELIPLAHTTKNEQGNGFVQHMQAGLKLTEAVVKNGTYILEIPEGYFTDSNGKSIAGVTLKYFVKNATAIEDIIVEGETNWTVYNLTGIKVLDTENAEELNTLPKGIYIINGRKALIR